MSTKAKTAQPARGRKRAAGQPRSLAPAEDAPVHMYCKCLADPEGSPACRLPDTYVSPTTAQKLTEEFLVTANADGDACIGIGPSLARGKSTHVVTAGVAGAAVYTAAADYAELSPMFDYVRVLTYQVTVTYIGAAQTAAGRLVTVVEPSQSYANSLVLTTAFDDGVSRAAVRGAIVRCRPTQPPMFSSITGLTSEMPTLPWVYIVAMALPPNLPTMSVRVTRHVEFVPKRSSVMRGTASVEPNHPGALSAAANMAHVGTVGAADEGHTMTQNALAAARYAWEYAQPVVREVGHAAATYASNAAKESLLLLMAG